MALTKFQRGIIEGTQRDDLESLLLEIAKRLQGINAYPVGIIPAVGATIKDVLDETNGARIKRNVAALVPQTQSPESAIKGAVAEQLAVNVDAAVMADVLPKRGRGRPKKVTDAGTAGSSEE